MPDTGAPWNIPYVAGTDLVSDWPTDSQTLAEAIADGLDVANTFKQIQHTLKDNTFTTTSATYVLVTDLEVTITPTSASSKVLVNYSVTVAFQSSTASWFASVSLFRDGTNLVVPASISGSSTLAAVNHYTGSNQGQWVSQVISGTFYDSPATTSAVTYDIRVAVPGGQTVYVNSPQQTAASRSVSWITAIEVDA